MASTTIIWLIAGIALCFMELVLPTAFVEFTMGVSALVVALVAVAVPQVSLQVALWLILSVILTILVRRFMPRHKSRLIEDAKEAKTLTALAPGQTGRVLYEGNSWQARCADPVVAIAPQEKVYVVDRQGTTLIVLPESMVHPD